MGYEILVNTQLRMYGGCGCGCCDIATLRLSNKKILYIECTFCGEDIRIGSTKGKHKTNTLDKLKCVINNGNLSELLTEKQSLKQKIKSFIRS